MSFTITFLPYNIRKEFDESILISEAARQAGLKMNLICGGKGKCGKCRVTLSHADGKQEDVLACQTTICADATIEIPERLIKEDMVILTGGGYVTGKRNPLLNKFFIKKEELAANEINGDWEQLKLALQKPNLASPPLDLLHSLSQIIRSPQGFTAIIYGDEVLDIEEGDTTGELYGMAIDIGTTTVASYLINLNTGKTVAIASSLNRQNQEGADVMSRMKAAEEGRLDRLYRLIIETINDLIKDVSSQAKISTQSIYHLTVVGNTTMQHLFFNLSPHYLGRTPFSSTHLGQITVAAGDISLYTHPKAKVDFLPLIGGFVGADTTAVIIATGLGRSPKLRLAVDIGTNGEMVLGNHQGMLACSTAAGPALEGAGITYGMRGAPGAIEDVSISNGIITLQVIGNIAPIGICGSGLIAAVAEMLKAKVMLPSGRIKNREEYLEAGGDAALSKNLVEVNNERRFILFSGGGQDVYLSQMDIRALQLAKGAIYTGIILLLDEKGITGKELTEILLAGAFGNHIDVEKAKVIGLLPDFSGVPVKAIGNAAGAGAQKALLSKRAVKEAQQVSQTVRHVDLATHPKFQAHFIKSLNFPELK